MDSADNLLLRALLLKHDNWSHHLICVQLNELCFNWTGSKLEAHKIPCRRCTDTKTIYPLFWLLSDQILPVRGWVVCGDARQCRPLDKFYLLGALLLKHNSGSQLLYIDELCF